MILCMEGTELLRRYEQATKHRAEARDDFSVSPQSTEENLFRAKEKYNQAFVDWVVHPR